MIDAAEALTRLRDGNARFIAGQLTDQALSKREMKALATDQAPFAIILGCSDSRVPAELVFDQGFGDLFVIRVAGNIVAPSQVGSVEFAAAKFGTKLVVVMGHQSCGAITAAVEELLDGAKPESKNLSSIVDRVKPAVQAVIAGGKDMDRKSLIREAVRANVRASVDHLRHGSALLEKLIRTDGLMIVGAKYSLDTGVVAFLD
ncbi:MAG TPA: carbonic anhydrase [Vicinamibacterales bacterium]|nr:carbonic anhydrase [Vicinamibacterales bacterium]